MSYVYAFDFGDMVKVGVTTNLNTRRYAIQHKIGRKAINTFSIPASIEVEAMVHRELRPYRIYGEFYNCSFSDACKAIEQMKIKRDKLSLSENTSPSQEELLNAALSDDLARYTFRVDPIVLEKLDRIARYNGRSKNREIEQLVRQHIREFEKEHGKIELEDT